MQESLSEERVTFRDRQGNTIAGILTVPHGSRKHACTILCHGFPSSKNSSSILSLSHMLTEKGLATLRFDFYGMGESEGDICKITIAKGIEDVLAAVNYVQQQGFTRVGIFGSSFGGMVAMYAASIIPKCVFLALKSPVSDYYALELARLGKEGIEAWKRTGFTHMYEGELAVDLSVDFLNDISHRDAYTLASTLEMPTRIVHGSADREVPIAQSKKWCSVHPKCELKVIEGADHQYTQPHHREQMLQALIPFMYTNAM